MIQYDWLLVSWELPSDTKNAKNAAARFKRFVLNLRSGPSRLSANTWLLYVGTGADEITAAISQRVPDDGMIRVIPFTDAQIAASTNLWGARRGTMRDDS